MGFGGAGVTPAQIPFKVVDVTTNQYELFIKPSMRE